MSLRGDHRDSRPASPRSARRLTSVDRGRSGRSSTRSSPEAVSACRLTRPVPARPGGQARATSSAVGEPRGTGIPRRGLPARDGPQSRSVRPGSPGVPRWRHRRRGSSPFGPCGSPRRCVNGRPPHPRLRRAGTVAEDHAAALRRHLFGRVPRCRRTATNSAKIESAISGAESRRSMRQPDRAADASEGGVVEVTEFAQPREPRRVGLPAAEGADVERLDCAVPGPARGRRASGRGSASLRRCANPAASTSSASSGQSVITVTLGNRSSVANERRGSTTTTASPQLRRHRDERLRDVDRADHDQPGCRVVCAAGTQSPSASFTVPFWSRTSARRARRRQLGRGVVGGQQQPLLARRQPRRHHDGAAWPRARSVSAVSSSGVTPELLHEHLHFAAAGQPDLPGAFVGDAEIQQLRHARPASSSCRGVRDGALDAAAADRSRHFARGSHRQLAAGRTRASCPQVSVTVASATCSPAVRASRPRPSGRPQLRPCS